MGQCIPLDNLVVSTTKNSVQWIDFDFASNIDHPMRYPLNWIIPLPDAQRHRATVAGNLILVIRHPNLALISD